MERIPGHYDELSNDLGEEAGSAAPLGEGRHPVGRARAGLVTTAAAILGLAGLALACQVSTSHRAAATLGDHPGQKRTRMFQSLNSNQEDKGTTCPDGIKKGDTVIKVDKTSIFSEGDCVVIVDTSEGATEDVEGKVKSVGSGEITLTRPVEKDLPPYSFIVVPADPTDTDQSQYACAEIEETTTAAPAPAMPEETPAPTSSPTPPPTEDPLCVGGERTVGCEFDCSVGSSNWMDLWSDNKKDFCCKKSGEKAFCEKKESPPAKADDGPLAWGAALLLTLGIAACCVLCGAFVFTRPSVQEKIYGETRAPKIRKKELDGEEWMFKPTDGGSVMTLTAPEFDAPVTGNTLEPGDMFSVISSQPPRLSAAVLEQMAGGSRVGYEDYQPEVNDGGVGDCLFLNLADGRGWVLDREPGQAICYKLFERVDELWIYDPENGLPIAIRDSPFVEGDRTNDQLQPGDTFKVCEMQASEDTDAGVLFLKLADGRGWVFDQKEWGGDLLCRRVEREIWKYEPSEYRPIMTRWEPTPDSVRTEHLCHPGDTFEVDEFLEGDDGELYLRLADGRGWLVDRHANLGTVCHRVS